MSSHQVRTYICIQYWLHWHFIFYSCYAVSFNDDDICDWLHLEQDHQSLSAGKYVRTVNMYINMILHIIYVSRMVDWLVDFKLRFDTQCIHTYIHILVHTRMSIFKLRRFDECKLQNKFAWFCHYWCITVSSNLLIDIIKHNYWQM